MSLETFYKTYTPTSEQTGWLASEKKNLELFDPLPVYFIGKLGAAAHESVVQRSNEYVKAAGGLTKEVAEAVSKDSAVELTTIYFTSAVQSIYQIFMDSGRHCTYDGKYYNTIVNNMLSGTAVDLYDAEDDKVDVYDGPRLLSLGRAIQEDPTFASLFKAPYTHLPDALKRDLGPDILAAIEKAIIPPYEKVARVLAEKEKRLHEGKQKPFEEGFSMKSIDESVAELNALIDIRNKAKNAV